MTPPYITPQSAIAEPAAPRRRRAVLAAALFAAGAATLTHSTPAAAEADHAPPTSTAPTAEPSEQSYTVPTTAQLPEPARTAEVTAVEPAAPRWVLPVPGAPRDRFGPRPDQPVPGVSKFHRGQDFTAGCGTNILAAASGRVIEAGWNGSYGNWVLLQHPDRTQTGYAHAGRLLVSTGQQVQAGTKIAEAGTTGASSGCHLHFEIRVSDKAIDPRPFLRARRLRFGTD